MALIVVFTNQSNLAPVSDYKVQVLVGDGTPERSQVLYAGKVASHRREDGWQVLLRQFVDHLSTED
jgi:hypothetical protein